MPRSAATTVVLDLRIHFPIPLNDEVYRDFGPALYRDSTARGKYKVLCLACGEEETLPDGTTVQTLLVVKADCHCKREVHIKNLLRKGFSVPPMCYYKCPHEACEKSYVCLPSSAHVMN
ncbi:hypothetical protein NM688_g4717 [Phlebia brevispora]|uniref:Uncharacterized protein n=1 Tax=Phlebia brevispora TaxID=194682 RepID=A0ACC1T2B1_9APHY|nr:hypothetical protein NM688_g4717 [Phlebia brevispora]